MLTILGLSKRGYEAELLSGPTTGPEGEIVSEIREQGIRLFIIPDLIREISPIRDLKAFFDIYRFLRKNRYDIVHTHSSKAGILGRLAAFLAGVPLIIHTIHGLPYHRFQNVLLNLFYIFAEKIAGYVSDSIIAVSRNNLEDAVLRGIAPRFKFRVIRSGMNIDRFQSASLFRNDIRKRYGISPDSVVIGVVARLFHLKGHKFILLSSRSILKEFPQALFFFVGDGILRRNLEEFASKLGVRDRFIFTGLIPRGEVPKYISAMDLIVHPSLREGLARVIPQGFILEKPVVIFDIDGANEVVRDNETGLLVKPCDVPGLKRAILDLLRNPSKARELGVTGKAIALQEFTDEKMVEDIHQLYRKLLNRKKAQS